VEGRWLTESVRQNQKEKKVPHAHKIVWSNAIKSTDSNLTTHRYEARRRRGDTYKATKTAASCFPVRIESSGSAAATAAGMVSFASLITEWTLDDPSVCFEESQVLGL
jgi:hypothetical protein